MKWSIFHEGLQCVQWSVRCWRPWSLAVSTVAHWDSALIPVLRPLLRAPGIVNTTSCVSVFLEPTRTFPVDSFWAFSFNMETVWPIYRQKKKILQVNGVVLFSKELTEWNGKTCKRKNKFLEILDELRRKSCSSHVSNLPKIRQFWKQCVAEIYLCGKI